MPSELAEQEINEMKAELISLYQKYQVGIDAYFLLDSQKSMFAQNIRNILITAGLASNALDEIQRYFFTNPEGFGFRYTVEQLASIAEGKHSQL